MRDDEVFDPEPEAPLPPDDSQCCGSGCDPCVWDTYRIEQEAFKRQHAEWQLRQASAAVKG